MRRVPQRYPNAPLRREHDPRAARRQVLLLASCLLLACGFVFAVSRQIMAVEYGYKTEALRRQREQLMDEQRRLLLEVEKSSSLGHLEQAAREMGMQPATAAQIESAAPAAETASAVQRASARVAVGAAAGAVIRR